MRWKPRRKRQLGAESLLRPQTKAAPDSLRVTMADWLEWLAVRNFSPATRLSRAEVALRFARWCEERGVLRPVEVTRPLLERYQRHLFYYRKPNGQPLGASSQAQQLAALRGYFKYLTRRNLLPANPASELELPKVGLHLPRYTMTAAEVEQVLRQPDVSSLEGLRDRAMLEVLWATGLRRSELCGLNIYDVSAAKGVVQVREGKGKKDRVVPIGARALGWVQRYLDEVRPRYVMPPDDGYLFLSTTGEKLSPALTSQMASQYVRASGVPVRGACHLFRHASATAMLEGGADIRFVQELLGHAHLESTQLYTRVTISKLKAIYEATHPAAQAELLAELVVEGDEEAASE